MKLLEESYQSVDAFTLDNGMRVLIKPIHDVPVVSLQIWLGTGAIHEDDYLGSGLSHYMEHMYFKGTDSLSANEIWQKIAGPGGLMNAYTTFDRTVFYADMPASDWRQGLEVMADAAQHASFPEEEWEREKNVILREMAMGADDPDRVISKLLFQTALMVHPLRHPVIGYEEVFRQRNRDDLLAFFKRHYTPDNMLLVLVGDVDRQEAEQAARDVFEAFPRRAREPVVLPEEPPQLAPRFARKTGKYQITRSELVWHTVPLTHPDAPALDVLSVMLGQGRSSLLSRELVEQNPVALSLDAWSYTLSTHGLFGVSASMNPENEDDLVQGVRDRVYSMKPDLFTQEDLEKAKRQIISGGLSGLETINGQARAIASGMFYAGNPAFSVRSLEAARAVTLDDVLRVAKTYLRPEAETLVLLSPDQIRGAEETASSAPLNPVQRVDTELGFSLLVREDRRIPKVYFSAVLGGGVLAETEEQAGITQLTSSMLTRGAAGRSAGEIAEWVESRGGSISPFSGNQSYGINASCLQEDAATFAELLRDCLLHPEFDRQELEKQRSMHLGQIKASQERPIYYAGKAMRETLFPGHPFRWGMLGRADAIESLQANDLKTYHAKLAVRTNLVLSVFGDIDAEEALSMVKDLFADMPLGEQPNLHHPLAEPALPVRIDQEEPFQQTLLLMGYPGVSLSDSRYDTLEIINEALSGLASDLANEVREKRGLVYYIGAAQLATVDPGFFYFYAGTQEESVEEVERLVNQEVERVRAAGLREDELSRARNQLKNKHFKQLQSNRDLAQSCAVFERLGGGYERVFESLDRYEAVQIEDTRRVAKEILDPARQAVSVVRPQEETTP